MSVHFALCLTCPEVTTGRLDSSKGWLLAASSNHHHCEVVAFTDYTTLPAPIRNVVLRLGAGAPITDNDITLFKLGLNLEDRWRYESTVQVAETTSATSPADAQVLAASTKSRPASRHTSTTPAPLSSQPAQLDLFGDAS